MPTVTFVAAFAAGVASFLSPCVLPLLPVYLAYLSGNKTGGALASRQFYLNTFCFLCGFVLVFVLMGTAASLLGNILFEYQDQIRIIASVFMVVMGFYMLGLWKWSLMERDFRPFLSVALEGPLGAFVLGVVVTVGWTPCTGPILASILLYAGTVETAAQGAVLLFIYALGFACPFLLLSLGLQQSLHRLSRWYRYLPVLQRLAGCLMILLGIAWYFSWTRYLTSYFSF